MGIPPQRKQKEGDSRNAVTNFNEQETLANARLAYPFFYAAARPRDMALMDGLVIGRVALAGLFNQPREWLAEPIRREFERTTNGIEQLFTASREAVRGCPTFAALPQTERAKIERELFDVPAVR